MAFISKHVFLPVWEKNSISKYTEGEYGPRVDKIIFMQDVM